MPCPWYIALAMGYGPHLSRREILNSIPVLTSGAALLPLDGQASPASKGVIRGALRDAVTGRSVAAKLSVTNAATGETYMPASCIKTMPKKSNPGRCGTSMLAALTNRPFHRVATGSKWCAASVTSRR